MPKFTGYFIFAMLVFMGCSGVTDSSDAPEPFLQTGESEYTPSISENKEALTFDISTTFENFREDSVYIVNCKNSFSFELQKRVAGEWTTALSPYTNACLTPPIKIAGGSHIGVQCSSVDIYQPAQLFRNFKLKRSKVRTG